MGRIKKLITRIVVLIVRKKNNRSIIKHRNEELKKMVQERPGLAKLVEHYKEHVKSEKS